MMLIEKSWETALSKEFTKDYFVQLKQFLNSEFKNKSKRILPEEKLIFEAYNKCGLEKVKVVILGQDPYPTYGHAHGLCFSIQDHVQPFAKSLVNIFKEIDSDLGIPIPITGNLTHWAKQGVFLLNTILTVEEGKPLSHANKGWENFTDETIRVINQECEHVVFLLWGAKAQKKKALIDQSKHLVLETVHPSPLSAYRGFFGCKHFSLTNTYLASKGLKEIAW